MTEVKQFNSIEEVDYMIEETKQNIADSRFLLRKFLDEKERIATLKNIARLLQDLRRLVRMREKFSEKLNKQQKKTQNDESTNETEETSSNNESEDQSKETQQ